jgi:hypothetical protein
MNTKLLMSSSAIVMGLVGIALSFAPDDILKALNIEPIIALRLMLQLLGALYLAFAMVNWMTKSTLIGGIFAKPISMGNGAHFFIGAMALLKAATKTSGMPLFWVAFAVYSLYAICFLKVAFAPPSEPK